MLNKISDDVKNVYNILRSDGHKVYFVGGCVRNLLIDTEPKDWDLSTNATPEQIQKIFPDSFYDNTFGTVGVPIKKGEQTIQVVEITTFRKESGYENVRHPSKVEWGKTIEEDLSRRDFTMNAIALEIVNDKTVNIIDPYNGQKDIKDKIIKTVRDPNERFSEDALRLLRLIRFATQTGFTVEDNTWQAAKKNVHLIQRISKERIRDELLKILASVNPYQGIIMLDEIGILDIIIPELSRGKGLSQERPGRHHVHDVFTHNLLALKHTPSHDPIVRLATLIHDVGKPYVENKDEKGLIIFHNHEVIGARLASAIAERLRLSKKQRGKIFTLVRWHMFTVDEKVTDSAIRRFIRRVGVENIIDMIDLRIGDRLGSGTQTAESWRLKLFKERIEKELNPPFSINDLAIDGNDVMRELGIKPGPQVGKILHQLFEEVDEDLSKNNREFLISRIHEITKPTQ